MQQARPGDHPPWREWHFPPPSLLPRSSSTPWSPSARPSSFPAKDLSPPNLYPHPTAAVPVVRAKWRPPPTYSRNSAAPLPSLAGNTADRHGTGRVAGAGMIALINVYTCMDMSCRSSRAAAANSICSHPPFSSAPARPFLQPRRPPPPPAPQAAAPPRPRPPLCGRGGSSGRRRGRTRPPGNEICLHP